jgi:hypothetical protein
MFLKYIFFVFLLNMIYFSKKIKIMINFEVTVDTLKEDYPVFFNFFKNTLNNSNSKFKNYTESKYKCYYSLGFYMKPSQKNEEYYQHLLSLDWENRRIEEYKKARVTITIVSGKFIISDQTSDLCDVLKNVIDEIVSRKIYSEQQLLDEPNEDIINSIPDLEKLEENLEKEREVKQNFVEELGKMFSMDTKDNKKLNLNEQLDQLINDEKYEEADEFIKKYPNLKKKKE